MAPSVLGRWPLNLASLASRAAGPWATAHCPDGKTEAQWAHPRSEVRNYSHRWSYLFSPFSTPGTGLGALAMASIPRHRAYYRHLKHRGKVA